MLIYIFSSFTNHFFCFLFKCLAQPRMVMYAEKNFSWKEDILCLEGYRVENLRSWKMGG